MFTEHELNKWRFRFLWGVQTRNYQQLDRRPRNATENSCREGLERFVGPANGQSKPRGLTPEKHDPKQNNRRYFEYSVRC